MNNIKSILAKDYIEFVNPEYIYIKVTPSYSIRNYNTDTIINLIAELYLDINKRIKKINNKLFFEAPSKVSYYIYIEKKIVNFYFIVPKKHFNIFREKIIDAWKNKITITQVENVPLFGDNCSKNYITYKYNDVFSSNCDKRDNFLLSGILNTLHIMQDGDRVGIFYNFESTKQNNWKSKYDTNLENIKNYLPKEKTIFDKKTIVFTMVLLLANFIDLVFDAVLPSSNNKSSKRDLELSNDTKKKRSATVVKSQILCLSESDDKQRENHNMMAICGSFDCLEADNSFVAKPYCKPINFLETKFKNIPSMIIQAKECQNFISLPAREMLEEYNCIEHTKLLETLVPTKLQSGYIDLGISNYKDNSIRAYLRDTYDQGNLPLLLIGSQGAGKTTFIMNYVKNIISRDEGCIVIDYIMNCKLSQVIEDIVPKHKLISLDLSDIYNCQGFGYNELKPKSNKYEDCIDVANRKALYVERLIDSLRGNGDALTSQMDRYLHASCSVVLLNENASLKDVIRCLNEHEFRKKCIDYVYEIDKRIAEWIEDEIVALKELDEYDKTGQVCGSKTSKVDGINHRINILKKDMRLKTMFNKPCKDNIDLVKAMDEGKVILIKMPEDCFPLQYTKNVITTYFFTKIWSAMQIRGGKYDKPKRFHIIVDELFQAKTAMKLLSDEEILPQSRKFGCKFVLSCQTINQMEIIRETIHSAGASYMLMKGSGKNNFSAFKDELAPFTLDDLEALPQYYSLNLINYEEGRAKFITKLPDKPY